MKKVLQIMGGLNRGGLEAFVMNIYRAINKEELQFDFLLTQTDGGDYAEEVKRLGGRIFTIPSRGKGIRTYKKTLNAFFKEHHNYLAIHEHISSLTSIEPAFYAKKYGIPIRIFHAHSSSISRNIKTYPLHYLLHFANKYKVHSYATHYLGCSDKAMNWVYNYTGVRHKAIMVNNGIEVSKYIYDKSTRRNVREELGIREEELLIGNVGRLIPLKNQRFLIDILHYMRNSNTHASLILVGDGIQKDELKEYAIEKGVYKYIYFMGIRKDVDKLLQAMDVFVMPSLFEGLPVSLIEAQAAGLPIIVSDTISRNTNITGTIIFKALTDPIKQWAEVIYESSRKERENNKEAIIKAGFDSTTTAQQMIKLYMQNE